MSKSRSGAPKRLAAGLLAGALAVVGLAIAPSAGATATVSTDRYAGTTRYGTAAAIAGQNDFKSATTAILATGENFPDALAASGVAGAKGPAAPIVLTQSGTYTQAAHDALNAFTNVNDVVIVGGTSAISSSVEQAVKDDGFNVTRLAGTDRFGTAAAIARAIGAANIGTVGGKKTALIANGLNYPDALAGGTISYAAGLPILLVTPSSVPAATTSALTDLGIQHVIILGGTAAVSDTVKTQLEATTGGPSERVADTDRFGTAAAVGEWAVKNLGWAPSEIELASGVNFPDALSGGPLGGERKAPIILLASAPDKSKKFADDHSPTISKVNCLGGTAACAEADLQTMKTAAQNIANDTPQGNVGKTSRPELVSAAMRTVTASQSTPADPTGTTVSFTFDEPVTGASPITHAAFFHIYTSDGVAPPGQPGAPDSVAVSSTDNKTVNVRWNALDTTAEVANIVLATVDAGAVCDGTCNPLNFTPGSTATNPEGDAPLGAAGSAAAAGVTAAPDLTGVGNFRLGASTSGNGDTIVDFTFDEAATVLGTAGYQLIPTANGASPGQNAINCTGPATGTNNAGGGTTTVVGGNGTTTISVSCPNTFAATKLDPANFARGAIMMSTVEDATGVDNPLESADISNGGNSDGADLVTAIFAPDAVSGFDNVAFVFDENVQIALDATKFNVYRTNGAQVDGITTNPGVDSPVRSPENNSIVAVRFPDGTLADSVGASVDPTAVFDLQNLGNQNDEVAVTPSGTGQLTPGRTAAPDLSGARSEDASIPGFVTARRIVFVFDEDTADAGVVATKLFAYTPDGVRLHCTATSPTDQTQRPEETDNEVACTSWVEDVGGAAATVAQVSSAVLAGVDNGAVTEESVGALPNPEGSEPISGSTGTPTA